MTSRTAITHRRHVHADQSPDASRSVWAVPGRRGLDGKNQRYTYFLVRQDGKFLVKRRIGDSTAVVTTGERVAGWRTTPW